MYPVELEIKDTTESNISRFSLVDLPFTTNLAISDPYHKMLYVPE